MRKFIPTLVLLMLLIAGFVYAKSENFFQKETPAPAKLSAVEASEVTGITVTHNGRTVELVKDKGNWVMKQPGAYPVNAYAVEQWLGTLGALTTSQTVEEQPGDTAKYGISTNDRVIQVHTAQGTTTYAVGSALPTGSGDYVQVNGKQVVAAAEQDLSGLLLAPLDFMVTTPFTWEDDNTVSLEWESPIFSWVGKRSGSGSAEAVTDWTLNGTKIEADQATSLLAQVKGLTTDREVRPVPELKKPVQRFTMTLTQTVNGREESKVYQGWTTADDPGIIWAVPPDSSWAYALKTDDVMNMEQAAKKALTSAKAASANDKSTAK
ncbi:DUF4340 domain-containing protein [Paenibacillus sp. JX-17]|uniref:DUF4340 domain-containing protein n=1 Tax=Paenibacillus lacisoli TaxID=3064525 RepID=A0ABT9CCJ6_9BACL|nr:DUF4340 domain-containing protein [Paenibacillus sp. JX-17]MDO7906974.1 DUF4340 domain-containing protein [Paenibacillus sp. JX-17]